MREKRLKVDESADSALTQAVWDRVTLLIKDDAMRPFVNVQTLRFIVIGGICFGGLACGGWEGTAPKAMKPPQSAVKEDLVSYSSGPTITVVAVDGDTYTLNIAAREITQASTGEILLLSEEQFSEVYAEFAGTVAADPVVPPLEAFDPNGCVPSEGVYCPLSSPNWQLETALVSKPHSNGRGVPRTRGGKIVPDFTIASADCQDIGRAGLSATAEYRARRETFLSVGFNLGTAAVFAGVTKKYLLTGTVEAAQFLSYVHERATHRTNMHILAWMWNSYGCNNPIQTLPPVYVTAEGGGISNICETAIWSISVDGGATWTTISVRTCYVN